MPQLALCCRAAEAEIDLSPFKPKSAPEVAPSPEVARETSEAGGFPSRAP